MSDPSSRGIRSGASDLNLIARAQRGDVEAIGHLYDEHHEALFRYLASRVENAEAEDLTGDVFLRMLAGLPHYRPSAAPFRAWLYRIARNLIADHYRRHSRRAVLQLDQAPDQPSDDDEPEQVVDLTLTFDQVRRALDHLDDAQREVVSLRFLSGLSLQEVAAVLNKSEQAIKALQHRGLVMLRHALAHGQV